jgi:hypothetical protein
VSVEQWLSDRNLVLLVWVKLKNAVRKVYGWVVSPTPKVIFSPEQQSEIERIARQVKCENKEE